MEVAEQQQPHEEYECSPEGPLLPPLSPSTSKHERGSWTGMSATRSPRRKEARRSSKQEMVTLLDRRGSSFSVSIDTSSDHEVEVGHLDSGMCDDDDGDINKKSGGGDQEVEVYGHHDTIMHSRFGDSEFSAETATTADETASGGSGGSGGGSSEEQADQLAKRAEALYDDDRLLASARLLRTVSDPSSLTPHHRHILGEATLLDDLVSNLSADVGGPGWKKQTETHGARQFLIYSRLDDETGTHARIETAIEPTLLVPLLSVLNETELYHTWLPNWTAPRLKVRRSTKLRQTGRCSQVMCLTMDVPWPLAPREVVLRAVGCDDIDDGGHIAVRLDSLDTGDEGGLVPPPIDEGAARVDFAGGFLFRRCPPDHPAAAVRKKKRTRHGRRNGHGHWNGHHHHHHHRHHHHPHHHQDHGASKSDSGGGGGGDSDLILVSFTMHSNPRAGSMLPTTVTSFVVRTAMGTMWNKFLRVAEDVRDGRRPRHAGAIESKRRTLYDWVEDRVRQMLASFGRAVPVR